MPSHEYSSVPRPEETTPKYRQGVQDLPGQGTRQNPYLPINIHHDPRVARGNTFAGDRRTEIPTVRNGA